MKNWIKLVEAMLSDAEIVRVLRAARSKGFEGFARNCGQAAIAINDVLFNGNGIVIGAFNKAFFEAGYTIGHIAVQVGDTFWDADARPKPWEEIESWGMLDEDDPDYAERAKALGVEWNEATANEVIAVAPLDIVDIAKHFPIHNIKRFKRILQNVQAAS